MTTSAATTRTNANYEYLGIWINRCLEGLWLLALGLVPLAFLSPDYVLSEAAISYVEVPKITLLRVLVGIMVVFWALEWALRSQDSSIPIDRIKGIRFQPAAWLSSLRAWLGFRQTRWLVLAVWFFFGTTLLSTLLSGSFKVSLWGDVPAQDGYSFYNVSSYLLLFAVISTHLKTRAQMWRLLGVLVAVGTVIGGYVVLQRNGHDFLGLAEQTGGFTTAFAGNTIFTAAVLLMTITVSVGVGAVTLRDPAANTHNGLRPTVRRWAPIIVLAWVWCFVISSQMLGLLYTSSRGPWLGTVVALMVLFVLAAWAGGWSYFSKVSALIGFPAAITLAIVQLNISMFHPGLWLGATIAIVIFFASVPVIGWRTLGRITLIGALAAGILVAVVITPALTGTSGQDASRSESDGQFGSVGSQVLGGNLGGRLTHWDVSWDLIRFRPWFEFDDLSLPWLRQLIGYGPELFRSTYLLKSPAEPPTNRPLEPDHAHNFLIHQTVEQGYLGFLSAAGLFAASFFVGARWILRRAHELSPVQRLILAVLIATMAGRFVEMLVGVARVSDLTILWGLMGLLAALPSVIKDQAPPEVQPGRSVPSKRARRRNDRRSSNRTGSFALTGQSVWRLVAVAMLIGGVGTLTWLKNVNYVRAAVVERAGVEQFRAGDWESTLESFDKAIRLAPDVTIYHNNRAELFLAFLINRESFRERACATQDEVAYDVCLLSQSYQSNWTGTMQRQLYYRSRLAFANSAFNLQLYDEAIIFYRDAVNMVPNSNSIRSALAEAYLEDGQTELAIEHLNQSLEMGETIEARLLLGIAQMKLGDTINAIESLTRGLAGADPRLESQAVNLLAEAYIVQGENVWNITTPPAMIKLWELVLKRDRAKKGKLVLTREGNREIGKILGAAYAKIDEHVQAANNYNIAASIDWELGLGEQAKDSLVRSLELVPEGKPARMAHTLLAEIAEAEMDYAAAAQHREMANQ